MRHLADAHWKSRCILGLILVVSIIGKGRAEAPSIRIIRPDSVTLTPSPVGPSSAYLLGSPKQAGLYVISAVYPAGRKGTPHRHPDQRVMTVISGTFYAGTGPEFDETKVQALSPGSVLIIPANALHWGWAKDGDVLVQEVGIGPTGTQLPAAASSK